MKRKAENCKNLAEIHQGEEKELRLLKTPLSKQPYKDTTSKLLVETLFSEITKTLFSLKGK